jgi:hypothetical protein
MPPGVGKTGILRLPNSSSKRHFSATSSVLATAAGTSAKRAAISAGVFR